MNHCVCSLENYPKNSSQMMKTALAPLMMFAWLVRLMMNALAAAVHPTIDATCVGSFMTDILDIKSMKNVIHIFNSIEEMQEIFDEGVSTLDRALELFMMIEKDDNCARVMVKRVYEVLKLGEDIQEGFTADG